MSLSRDDEDDDDEEEFIHHNLKAPEELPNKGDESEEDAPVFNEEMWGEIAERWGEKMATVVEDKVLNKCPPEAAYWATNRIRDISQNAIMRNEFIGEVQAVLDECEKQVRSKGGVGESNKKLIGQMRDAFGRGEKVEGRKFNDGQFVRITSTRPQNPDELPYWDGSMDDYAGLVGVINEYREGFPVVSVVVDGSVRRARFNEDWLSAATTQEVAPDTKEFTEDDFNNEMALEKLRENYGKMGKKKKMKEFHKFLAAEQVLEAKIPSQYRSAFGIREMQDLATGGKGQSKLPTKQRKDENKDLFGGRGKRGARQQMEKQDYAPVPLATFKPNLTNLLQMSQDGVERFIEEAIPGIKKYDKFLYRPGDIPIMVLAHMDTVCQEPPRSLFFDGQRLWANGCLGADDRAGVYAVLKILEKGLRPHVMFTRDEEIGNIGASAAAHQLKAPEGIRYIIELDRKGVQDAVFYQDDNQVFHKYITDQTGYPEARGSMSDISEICPAWGVAGVNMSIGFENEHRDNEILDIKAMHRTIDKVVSLLTVPVMPEPFKYEATRYAATTYYPYSSLAGGGFDSGEPYSWQQDLYNAGSPMLPAVPGQNLPDKPVFRTGDIVRLITSVSYPEWVGLEFVVSDVANDGAVGFQHEGAPRYQIPSNFQLVKSVTETQPVVAKPTRFEIGDRVAWYNRGLKRLIEGDVIGFGSGETHDEYLVKVIDGNRIAQTYSVPEDRLGSVLPDKPKSPTARNISKDESYYDE